MTFTLLEELLNAFINFVSHIILFIIMNIIYIHKDKFHKQPPGISVLLILSDLGHKVTLIDEGVSDFWKEELGKRNISFYEIPKYQTHNPLLKIWSYLKFRKDTFSIIKSLPKNEKKTLWIEGAHTIVALGGKINKYPHILHIEELHEKSRRQLNAIRKVIKDADFVFMPEYNRTQIYRAWFNLKKTPILLPNKPYLTLGDKECDIILAKYSHILPCNKKIIIYQGGIKRLRRLDRIAKAIKEIKRDYHLLIVGPEQERGVINSLKEITSEITHVGFLPAPDYLAFCKIAYLGVVFYDPISLNNIYCAPNKIFEYSLYKLPMIGNDIPGLKETIESKGAGICVNLDISQDIVGAINSIEKDYSRYQEGAELLYNSVNNKKTIYDCIGGHYE